uniref:Cadherin-related family member 4 n=1 Tax=Cricetulus griseus TaxID=10029 RepID=A0A8C2MY04_CRIGR
MTPLIVTDVETFWKPEPWFVVVLTTTGAAFLLALGWLLSRVLRSIQGNEGSIERLKETPRMEMSQQHFDGRAHDVCTGRDYLFNTRTGARRWL